MLETIDIATGRNPDASIIWLHGLGADGHDFEPIVPELVSPGERAWRFIFPHAQVRPVTINNGMAMRAWYDIMGFDRGARQDIDGFRTTDALMKELVRREIERGIRAERIVLGGFSQGGAVSLYVVPRLELKLAGVLALSCYLPCEASFVAERRSANDETPIFMAHGRADGVLPMSMGVQSREFLLALGYAVEWHDYPMAHAVCPAEIADIRAWLRRVLP